MFFALFSTKRRVVDETDPTTRGPQLPREASSYTVELKAAFFESLHPDEIGFAFLKNFSLLPCASLIAAVCVRIWRAGRSAAVPIGN
jgi:hypothetical protein